MTEDGWLAAMVADGVSSSPLAEEGAEIAVRSCQEYFSSFRFSPYLNEEQIQHILYDAFNYALRKIQQKNGEGEHIPYARYTTLHLLLYGRRIGLHWGQAGDGAVYLFDRENHWLRIGEPMKNNREENSPVTLQEGPESWRFGSLNPEGLDAILMTTDGLAEVLEQQKDQTREILKLLTNIPEDMENSEKVDTWYRQLFSDKTDDAMKSDAEVSLQKVTDDLTVLLVKRLSEEEIMSGPETRKASPLDENGIESELGDEVPKNDSYQQKQDQKGMPIFRFFAKLLGIERHPSEEEQHEA